MLKQSVKYPSFSEYDFIRLYCAISAKKGSFPVIVHHELEKDLYKFYFLDEYKDLFEDIVPQTNNIDEQESYLNLNAGIQLAQTFYLLMPIHDNGEIRSMNICNIYEADKIIDSYSYDIVEKMSSLIDMKLQNNSNIKVMKKI